MFKYVIRRFLLTIPTLFGVTLAAFLMLYLTPGDPVRNMLMNSQSGSAPTGLVSQEMIDNLTRELGLDKSLPEQYFLYIGKILRGDWGNSFRNGQPVSKLLSNMIPFTMNLAIAGMGAAILIGVTLGIIAGLRPNSWVDNLSMSVAMIGVSMPGFWLGLMLLYVFALKLKLLPSIGFGSIQTLILPAITLGLQASAIIARLTRSSILEIMYSDYIRTARSKGMKERMVVIKHALRNALIPVVTIIGLQFGGLLSGAVVVESVFGRPGIGKLGVDAITTQDFPLAQGFILTVALVYVFANLLIDLMYVVIDPRIQYE